MPKSRGRRRPAPSAPRQVTTAALPGASGSAQVEQQRLQRLREWRRRRLLARSLMAAGVVVALAHLLEHFGLYTLYRSGVDDLVAGYPMGGLLFVIGAMKLPAH